MVRAKPEWRGLPRAGVGAALTFGPVPGGRRVSRWVRLAAALGLTAFATAALAQVPVIPGVSGFGINTPAGRGGQVFRVTNLNESGAGSLAECVTATGPRVCIFEVSGTIKLGQDLKIWNPNLTIAGQTAPSPGIMLRGAALVIAASDVLVQHVRIRAGDDPTGPDPYNRDAIKVESQSGIRNVVIDHCSFSWATDEIQSTWGTWDNVTFKDNIIAEALYDSLSRLGPQGYGALFGPGEASVSMIGNLFAHNKERNPLTRATRFVFVNNVVYNRMYADVQLQSEGYKTDNSIVGNVFLRGPDYANARRPVVLRSGDSLALLPGTRVYVADNQAQEATSDPWSVVTLEPGLIRSAFEVTAPPVWPTGLNARRTAGNEVLNYVLDNAGARPADRDPVDLRIVQSVKDRGGQIINCVQADGSERCKKNAGGWPSLAQNTRKLVLPADPNKVGSDGYTNLEKWLHDLAAEVEGRAARPQPPEHVGAQ